MIFRLPLSLGLLALAQNTYAQVPAAPMEFTFATTQIGNFELSAATQLQQQGMHPWIAGVLCRGKNKDIGFVLDRWGRLVELNLPAYSGWLWIEGERYEVKSVSLDSFSEYFDNYPYPQKYSGSTSLVWRGITAVRARDSTAFMHISRIHGQILSAKRLHWQLQPAPPGDGEPAERPDRSTFKRSLIDNERIGEALRWCTEKVSSAEAKRLPEEILTHYPKAGAE